jgi:hypothetical protein
MADPKFVEAVLRLYEQADAQGMLYWRFNPELRLLALCNDVFYWGAADCEEITPDNIVVLAQAQLDAMAEGEMLFFDALFAARVRHLRPQRPFLRTLKPSLRALFEACGPERDAKDEG